MKNIFLLLVTFIFYSCGNSQEKRSVKGKEASTILSIDEKTNVEIDNYLSTSNQRYNCVLAYNRYENNKLIKSDTTSALAFSRFEEETVSITGFAGEDEGFGFILVITKDTCMIRCDVESTKEIFKLKKDDVPTFGIHVPCKYQKATLASNPKSVVGEIIKGKIEIKSDDYYEKINNQFKLIRMEIKGYFISEPMPIKNGKYKTLVKQ
jgi:hypothetical protein